MKYIHFIETPIFTQRIVQLLSDDDYARLQYHLCTHKEREEGQGLSITGHQTAK